MKPRSESIAREVQCRNGIAIRVATSEAVVNHNEKNQYPLNFRRTGETLLRPLRISRWDHKGIYGDDRKNVKFFLKN